MDTTNVEVIELSLEKAIETKLIQANVTEQILGALKQKYGGMKLAALNDKESYLEIKAAAKDCAKVRTLTVKICKEGRDEAVKTQKSWIAKEKEIVGKVAEVEDALDAETKKYDDEIERLSNEEKERQESAYINRQAALTKMGASYTDGSFVLGEASFESNLIKGSEQDIWEETILPKFQAEYEKIEAVKISEQKKKDDEAKELKRQQNELTHQQEEFKKQQAELQRKLDEANKVERDKKQAEELAETKRRSDLQNKRFEELFPYNSVGEGVDMATLWTLEEDNYATILADKKGKLEAKKTEDLRLAEEKRLADIEFEKKKAIKDKEEQDRLDTIKKQQELDAAGDKTKWADFVNQVKSLQTYDMRSGQYRTKMMTAIDKIAEIVAL